MCTSDSIQEIYFALLFNDKLLRSLCLPVHVSFPIYARWKRKNDVKSFHFDEIGADGRSEDEGDKVIE